MIVNAISTPNYTYYQHNKIVELMYWQNKIASKEIIIKSKKSVVVF